MVPDGHGFGMDVLGGSHVPVGFSASVSPLQAMNVSTGVVVVMMRRGRGRHGRNADGCHGRNADSKRDCPTYFHEIVSLSSWLALILPMFMLTFA
jgi:hypothetical protein